MIQVTDEQFQELINQATPYPFRTYGGGVDLLPHKKKR